MAGCFGQGIMAGDRRVPRIILMKPLQVTKVDLRKSVRVLQMHV